MFGIYYPLSFKIIGKFGDVQGGSQSSQDGLAPAPQSDQSGPRAEDLKDLMSPIRGNVSENGRLTSSSDCFHVS